MNVPKQWRTYDCEDYFCSPLCMEGYFDKVAQLWLIEPAARVEEDVEAGFLQVGRPGVDSIGFGYRKGYKGLWAIHRMELRFQWVATTVIELVDGWLSSRIEI